MNTMDAPLAKTSDASAVPASHGVLTHSATGRPYAPQGLLAYLLGRSLDLVVVVAVVTALGKGVITLYESTNLSVQEWQPVAAIGLILFTVIFLYGGLAGTVGTLGEAATKMRVVNIDTGRPAGFLHGGLRAVGWVLFVAFTMMLNDSGVSDTRYVAIRPVPPTTDSSATP